MFELEQGCDTAIISLKDFANTEASVLDRRGVRFCKIVATVRIPYGQ